MSSPNFGRQRVPWTARPNHASILSSAERIAPLDQVIWKHPVNGRFLIKAVLNQLFEIRRRLRSIGVIKCDRKTAFLPFFAFSPLNVENGDRICQRSNHGGEQDRRQD